MADSNDQQIGWKLASELVLNRVRPRRADRPGRFATEKLESDLVDADAWIPGKGYICAEGLYAPEVTAAFAQRAEELRQQCIPASGDFATGWIDSSACCWIIAEVVGLPKPSGAFDSEQVREIWTKASWPNFDELQRGAQSWDVCEYELYVVAKAFVDLCIEHNLGIEFS